MYQELAQKFITECVNPERTLSEREVNLIDSFAIYLQLHAAQQGRRQDTKGVYCRNCEAVIEFGEMKPYRKDDDNVDMLCSGCDSVLVEGE